MTKRTRIAAIAVVCLHLTMSDGALALTTSNPTDLPALTFAGYTDPGTGITFGQTAAGAVLAIKADYNGKLVIGKGVFDKTINKLTFGRADVNVTGGEMFLGELTKDGVMMTTDGAVLALNPLDFIAKLSTAPLVGKTVQLGMIAEDDILSFVPLTDRTKDSVSLTTYMVAGKIYGAFTVAEVAHVAELTKSGQTYLAIDPVMAVGQFGLIQVDVAELIEPGMSGFDALRALATKIAGTLGLTGTPKIAPMFVGKMPEVVPA